MNGMQGHCQGDAAYHRQSEDLEKKIAAQAETIRHCHDVIGYKESALAEVTQQRDELKSALAMEETISFRRQMQEYAAERDCLMAALEKLTDVFANIGLTSGIYEDEQAALEEACAALARVKESK